MRGAITWLWLLAGLLSAIAGIGTIITLALHFSPAVIHTDSNSVQIVGASWGLVATFGIITVAFSILSLLLYALLPDDDF